MERAVEEYSPQRVVALDTYSPAELKVRLGEMKQETDILQEFFAQVMHPSRPGTADGDYGVIPGTPRPTLLKPGAEKLLEYYGYAPTIKAIEETADRESGFYRARVTLALVSKRTGVVVAEGVTARRRETEGSHRHGGELGPGETEILAPREALFHACTGGRIQN